MTNLPSLTPSGLLHELWGGQSWLQPPFRRLLGTMHCRRAPAESRRQPGLAAPLALFLLSAPLFAQITGTVTNQTDRKSVV